MGLFPEASADLAARGGLRGARGILYGALCACGRNDVKRLVAYSSVAHLGYVMLGLFARPARSLEGSVLQMVNHGISTGALFLLVGFIYDRRHTRHVATSAASPSRCRVYATIFVIATLASIGLPGTNGFVGEFNDHPGTFVSTKLGHANASRPSARRLAFHPGALYMLSVVQKMFFRARDEEGEQGPAGHQRPRARGVAPLVMMIFVIDFSRTSSCRR